MTYMFRQKLKKCWVNNMNWSLLIAALIVIESGGDVNAVGDNGEARGILQIHSSYWQDGAEELVRTGKWKQPKPYLLFVGDVATSKVICRAYLTRWGRYYRRKTGKMPTMEILARIHNGGPNGWKKKATLPYWRKVQAQIRAKTNESR